MTETRTIDSSEVLRVENYMRKVREVSLMKSEHMFTSLDSAIRNVYDMGFSFIETRIVNVVHGEPSKNEPRVALILESIKNVEAMIIESPDTELVPYHLYYLGNGYTYLE